MSVKIFEQKATKSVYVFNLNMSPSEMPGHNMTCLLDLRVISFFDCYCAQVLCATLEFAIFAYVDTWAGLGGWGGVSLAHM